MTKSNALWFGTLAVLVGGLAIDRHVTNSHLKDLEHKYNVMVEAATARRADEGNAVQEQPTLQGQAPNAVPVAVRASVPTSNSNRPSSAESPPGSAASEAPSLQDQAAYVDTVFSDERPDQNWSRDAESKLTSALLPFAVGGSRIQRVECHSTLCKVRVEHASDAGFQDFAHHLSQPGYWRGAMVSIREPNGPKGTASSVMYFSKEGHDMPYLPD